MPPRERMSSFAKALLRSTSERRLKSSPLSASRLCRASKFRHALLIEADDFRIQYGGAFYACRFLDNARVTVGPVVAVLREQRTRPSRTCTCKR
jgi:hypothetical protein